ncbi:hypothetical protein [Spirochaeta africana]|uniref:Uncharacterized protein n=1 Tax=Spirochaeta africana (strain ATCC 700263 / DSM 8902 / Z-7692) TaxID=889378 RepID=H9UGG6_SPIAZ|nr:hypothetical protein [Spirochaeta africana]AFG36609.1 hypothetical protein Spiaf_0506 [Spirochaeta africana DSM 8902]
MKKILLGLIILAAAVALSGCMTTYTATDGNLAYASVTGEARGDIAVDEGYIYIIHPSLFVLGDNPTEQLDIILEPALTAADANAVTNMTIRDGYTFVDFILSSFVPFLSWGTVEVEGAAIQQ